MKKIVKPLFFAILCLVSTVSVYSQIKGSSNSGALTADFKKIIRDYPHQFVNLQGNIINQNPQSTEYDCAFKVEGAESSSITMYSSTKKGVYSWQATMLTTENFEEARKKFKSLFSLFNHLAVKMDYGDTFLLSGKYDEPTEEKNFTSAILVFEKSDQLTRKMKLEISMQYELLEWKVRVLIYEKDREDNERGEIEE